MEEQNQQEQPQAEEKQAEQPQQPTGEATEAPVSDEKDIEDNKLIAALSYLGILVLIPLLAKKESKFAQFHAKQGLVFLGVFILGMFVFWIPLIGWILWLAVVVLDIIAIVQALSGKYWKVPVIGDLAKKINI